MLGSSWGEAASFLTLNIAARSWTQPLPQAMDFGFLRSPCLFPTLPIFGDCLSTGNSVVLHARREASNSVPVLSQCSAQIPHLDLGSSQAWLSRLLRAHCQSGEVRKVISVSDGPPHGPI